MNQELSNHIREEIAKEMTQQRGGGSGNNYNSNVIYDGPITQTTQMAKNLEQYVMHTEAHSHTCKICFELMVSPMRTPMFLYPCGHTFCKECMNTHINNMNNNTNNNTGNIPVPKATCPFCRLAIQSIVPNQAIKEIIDTFVEKKSQVRYFIDFIRSTIHIYNVNVYITGTVVITRYTQENR